MSNITSGFVTTSDGIRIAFNHYKNGNACALVIAHGFYNSKQSVLLSRLALDLSDQYDVIVMDFRGHGHSGGLFTWTSNEYKDLASVLEYARGFYRTVGVIGFSLGAATCLITAAKTNLANSVIAVSGPVAFDKIEYHFWELDPENDLMFGLLNEGGKGKGVRPGPFWLLKEKPIEIVEKITTPVYYIHGDKDWLIYPWHAQALYDRTIANKKISIFENGPHAEYIVRKNHDPFVASVKKWFYETL